MKIKAILTAVAFVALLVPTTVLAGDFADWVWGPPTVHTINSVIVEVKDAVSNKGVENSLVAKLTNANEKADSNPAVAKRILGAVQNQLDALSGKKVDAGDAARISSHIDDVISRL